MRQLRPAENKNWSAAAPPSPVPHQQMPSRGIKGIYLEKDGKTLKSPTKGPKQALVFGTVIVPARIVMEATRLPFSLIYGVGHTVETGISRISTPRKIPILSKKQFDNSIYIDID